MIGKYKQKMQFACRIAQCKLHLLHIYDTKIEGILQFFLEIPLMQSHDYERRAERNDQQQTTLHQCSEDSHGQSIILPRNGGGASIFLSIQTTKK